MAKSFSKGKSQGKKNWKSRTGKAPEVKLPQVLFFWRQPPQEHLTPWFSLWPSGSSFDAYVEPFFGSGFGWIRANDTAQEFFVNDRDYEYVCAMRTVTRGDSNLREGVREWVRIMGVMDTWPVAFLGVWHSFHLEQVKHGWSETPVLKSKMANSMETTLRKLIEMQAKEFTHQVPYFGEALRASLVAVFRKCFVLAKNNGGPLPPETLVTELQKAMRYAAFMYAQHLYNLSYRLGNFIDPHHVMAYVMLHSIAKKDSTGQWKLRPTIPFEDYEKSFRAFESPLVHTLGRQTQFQHSEASVFLKQAPQHDRVFTFVDVPEHYPSLTFGGLYDLIWQRKGLFLILAPEEMANAVNHLGPKKTWTRKGVPWVALSNYGEAAADGADNDAGESPSEEVVPDFGSADDLPNFD